MAARFPCPNCGAARAAADASCGKCGYPRHERIAGLINSLSISAYEAVRLAASQLTVADRLRLIDELASSVPDDEPPQLTKAWLRELDRRSAEIDSGTVTTEDWVDVRTRLSSSSNAIAPRNGARISPG